MTIKTYNIKMTGATDAECLAKMEAVMTIINTFSSDELIEFGAKMKDPKKVQKLRNFKHLL